MDNKVKIWFVGAGSGAPDLITVRGLKLLQAADMIIYAGSLVNPALLDNAKDGCEIYDSARLHLDQAMDLMIPAALAGQRVVRLHTGDPSIYGAIREQMDRLDAAGVEYEVCPGVSSFCGAAAALKKEYTLPGVSQTLILTRMEGRTPVPEGERIRALAAHGASMALFLSASMLEKLQAELLAGGDDARRVGLKGYDESTPCAIVYKATWPDEKKIETTLGSLAQAAADAGITKTALILVGGFLGDEYELSKLYDAGFSTEFRKAVSSPDDDGDAAAAVNEADDKKIEEHKKKQYDAAPAGRRVMNAAVICYTDKGETAAAGIAEALAGAPGLAVNSRVYRFAGKGARTADGKNISLNYDAKDQDENDSCKENITDIKVKTEYFSDTKKLMRKIFRCGRGDADNNDAEGPDCGGDNGARTDAVIFVSAAGIAVRAVAPYALDKTSDPAVIVVNDNSDYVIPVLSGHIGGANALSEALAEALGAEAVITTASDGAGVKAADTLAQENGFAIEDMRAAKLATAALLKRCGGASDGTSADACDGNLEIRNIDGNCVLTIDDITIPLRPLKYCIGIGCKKNTDTEKLKGFLNETLAEAGIPADAIYRAASIDIKAGEPAIKAAADMLGAPFYVYSAEQLKSIEGDFTGSDFVKSVTGVDSVCERSAAAACDGAYKLVVRKTAFDGMTIAVAERRIPEPAAMPPGGSRI